MKFPRALFAFILLMIPAGCGSDDADLGPDPMPQPDASAGSNPDAGPSNVFGGDRPVSLLVPSGYDPASPAPLVLALHGFSPEPAYWAQLSHLGELADQNGYLFAAPWGTANRDDRHFWNATDACCNLYDDDVDDVAYLVGLIDEISAAYAVDPKRVYLVGHSNGAFMTHRMACEAADKIAAIISFAGVTWATPESCAPSEPVNVLHIHGDGDTTILFDGGIIQQADQSQAAYPGAEATVASWAALNGCGETTTAGEAIDVDALAKAPDGSAAEAVVSRYDGCPAGGAAELWRLPRVEHMPVLGKRSAEAFWTWLAAHPKP